MACVKRMDYDWDGMVLKGHFSGMVWESEMKVIHLVFFHVEISYTITDVRCLQWMQANTQGNFGFQIQIKWFIYFSKLVKWNIRGTEHLSLNSGENKIKRRGSFLLMHSLKIKVVSTLVTAQDVSLHLFFDQELEAACSRSSYPSYARN